MSASTTQTAIANPFTPVRRQAAAVIAPLFLPVKAPQIVGEANEYKLLTMQPPTNYAVHWDPTDGRSRAMCHGPSCQLCRDGRSPEIYHAAVALDRVAQRFVIVQMSDALVGHLADEAGCYVDWLRYKGLAEHVGFCDAADPWQPIWLIKAWRSPVGPRYEVCAVPVNWVKGNEDAEPMSFEDFRETPKGSRWFGQAEANTARPLRRAMPDFSDFDPLPLIFPEEFAEAWHDDLDE